MTDTTKYTDQQAAAIFTTGVSIALSAGAGCGKTFVLTQRFLRHLEPDGEAATLSSLVAITFTDRAAREMRDRVREACQQRLEHCPPEHVDYWLKVLRGLDSARISTIHAFCTTLLRSHAIEAGLNPGFSVLEPPLAETLLDSATESVLHGLLIADDADAVAYVLRFGLERTRELVRQLARQRFRVDWSSWTHPTPDELAERWLHAWQQTFRPQLIQKFRDSPLVLRLRELLSQHTPKHAEMQSRCVTLLDWLNPHREWKTPEVQLQEIRDAAKVQGGGGKSAWESEDIFEDVKESFTKLRQDIDQLTNLLEFMPDDVALAAEFACRGYRLARQVAEAYETSKLQAGVLDFDDLLLRARNLLRDHPEARVRFAQSIRLLLVDEFQDTDPVQADIVRDLCGEALRHGKLFLVGDSKQSIYRFRRADPEVFRKLREELPPQGQLLLNLNFRSQPEILKFVNLLFQDALPGYEPLVPFHDEQRSPGKTIEFLFATSDVEPRPNAEGKPKVDDLRQREATWMARRIVALLNDPTPRIRDKDPLTGQIMLRRVQLGDITILFRALTNVQEYEQQLRNYGLEYYLVGGKTFYAQQEVFDLLNLCRCLDNPNDVVSLLGVLRSPFFGLSDDDLQALHPADGDWWTRIALPPPAYLSATEQARIVFAGRTLHDLRTIKDELTIRELLTAAVNQTGYDAALLLEFLGSRKVANLRKLIEQAATFDGSELFTLKDYVVRLETSVLEETDEAFATTLPEAGNVIRLMSIHQSKGLEFPVVIVADLDRRNPNRTPSAYLHNEWGALVKLPDRFGKEFEHLGLRMLKIEESAAEDQETLRLFYVAVTRAADHLILSAGREHGAKLVSPWMELLATRFDLMTGHPVGDPLLGSLIGATSRAEIPDIRVHPDAPIAEKQRRPHDHPPLSTFQARLEATEAVPFPETLAVYSVDAQAPQIWSVSHLEELDATLQNRIAPRHAPSGEDFATAETLGTFLHAVLERIDFARPDTWEACLNTVQKSQREPLDATVLSTARDVLERLGNSDFMATWSAARTVQRELDFLLPWPPQTADRAAGTDLVSGQIDLLLQNDAGQWWLYDFKTGVTAASRSDDEILAPYTFQLGVYAWAIEAWTGQTLHEIALVLVRPRVRLVKWHWTAARKAEIEQRLSRAIQQAHAATV